MSKTKTKKKKMTLSMLEDKITRLESSLDSSDLVIDKLRKHIKRVELNLRFFINKQTAEIRVLEKDGKWGGYTGVFYINSKDDEKIITKKALNHYEEYFKDVEFFKNRTLGLFLTNPKGKKLVKILQKGDQN